MTNIYQIKKEYENILSNEKYVDFETWEISEEWIQSLKNNQDTLENKCENIARLIYNSEVQSMWYKLQIDRLNKLKAQNDNRSKWLKKLLDFALDWQELQTELFKFTYRKSEKTEILEKEKLPKQFITTEMIEKIAWLPEIKKYLKTEIEARIEEAKQDNKEYYEEDIKIDVYSKNGINITFHKNLQIK